MGKLLVLFVVGVLNVQALDFNYQLTGSNESILILESVNLSSSIPNGSVIGSFYVNNQGKTSCAGSVVWTSNISLGFPIWGSGNSFDKGFTEGEEILWYIQCPSGVQYKLAMSYGDTNNHNKYYTNSFRVINGIAISDEVVSDIYQPLTDGSAIYGCLDGSYTEYNQNATVSDGTCSVTWEYLYNNVRQNNLVLQEEISSLELVTNQANYLYQTQLLENIELQNIINQLESSNSEKEPIYVDMNIGWNLIGFTQAESMEVSASIASILESVELIKDNEGNAFWVEYNFNGIGYFTPGMGYQVKLNEFVNDFSFPNISGQ